MIEIVEVGIYVLFEALSVIYCLHYLYGEKIQIDMKMICLIIFDEILMEIVCLFDIGQIWSLLIYPIIIIYCGLRFGFRLKTILINNVLYMGILSSIQASIMFLLHSLLNVDRVGTRGLIFINIVIFGIVIIGLRRCKLNKLSNVLQENDKLVLMSLAVIAMSISVFLITYKKGHGFDLLFYIALGMSVLMIVLSAIDIGKHKIKAKEVEAELRLHKLYESSFRELIDEICARQHEFDNHINVIYSQHRIYKTYDELVDAQKKYCEEVIDENHFNKVLSKGNPVILCFLYSKLSDMKKQGIIAIYKINIGDLRCAMPVHKMVELLGNLINNAIEAVKIRGEGRISIVVLEENNIIKIEVSNECEEIEEKKIKEFFKKGYSEKGKKRGYGLYNVGKICEEYDAVAVCKNEEKENRNWLTFKVIINKFVSKV